MFEHGRGCRVRNANSAGIISRHRWITRQTKVLEADYSVDIFQFLYFKIADGKTKMN
jgi:hypothetical protein